MVYRPLLMIALVLAAATGWTAAAENETRDASAPAEAVKEGSENKLSDEQPNDGGDSADSEEAAEKIHIPGRNPRVLFITMQGCERCTRELARLRRPGGDFEAMRSRGWKIGESDDSHLQIVDRSAIPKLVTQLNIREYPAVACVSDTEIVRSFKSGCTTPLDSWTFGWLLKGKNERPNAPIPEAVRVETTGSYRLRGNHWSVDGDWAPTRATLVSHLRSPNHSGQLASNWRIEGWSYEELRSLHDDLHERELANSPAGYATESSSGGGSSSGSQFGAGRKALGR
jgi:hypothetical protein